jgi:hypothetical protein
VFLNSVLLERRFAPRGLCSRNRNKMCIDVIVRVLKLICYNRRRVRFSVFSFFQWFYRKKSSRVDMLISLERF